MTFNIFENGDFKEISQDILISNGLLKDAWVQYKGEKWYPVLVKDQKSGVRGFEVNFSGDWGKNDEVGRKKIGIGELLTKLVDGSIPSSAALRCKRLNDSQRNGRDISKLEFSSRLNNILTRLRTEHQFTKTLNKAPITLVQVTDDLIGTNPKLVDEASSDDIKEQKGIGYESDPKIRKAIENHAVAKARDFYERQGYSVEEKGKPYDLLCKKSGEFIHVEVKGSRGVLDAVIVTINEISDARNTDWRSDLFLVDSIILKTVGQDIYETSAGRCRRALGWIPEEKDMTPTQYRYKLPFIPYAE
jgi:hypothetical protein